MQLLLLLLFNQVKKFYFINSMLKWTLIYEIHILELRIKIELCEDHRSEGVST